MYRNLSEGVLTSAEEAAGGLGHHVEEVLHVLPSEKHRALKTYTLPQFNLAGSLTTTITDYGLAFYAKHGNRVPTIAL